MKIDNIDNITNKEKSPDKAERSASIDELKKTQKFFDFNDLSSNATTINKNSIIPEKEAALFEYISPGNSKLKKLLLNSDPEVANLNINNEKVDNKNEYLNNNNSNNLSGTSTYNVLPSDSPTLKSNNNNNILKPKSESKSLITLNDSNVEKRSTRNLYKPKLFWCSECNEYFLKFNLFNHMKSVHNKFTCLYCYGFFVKIENLEKHLVKKHKVQNILFSDEQTLKKYFDVKETQSISKVIKAVCCKCGSIFMITDNNFNSHCCNGGNENFLAIKEQEVQSNLICSDNNTDLAVRENVNCIDSLTTSSVNQLNSTKDDMYCEKAIQQWLQPTMKSTLNGAANISNEASSQNVPAEFPLHDSKYENTNSSWHLEQEKLEKVETDKLIVPKLTLKIPKGFQNQKFNEIDSDEDSGDEDEESAEEESVSENCEVVKNKSNDKKNLSNSINEYSSSLSDSDIEDSLSKKQNEMESSEHVVKKNEEQKKMPCLKLKIKNLTSNPESFLENFEYSSKTPQELDEKLDETNETAKTDWNTQTDVDMSECPMDIEPSLETTLEPVESEPEPKKIIIDGNIIIPANEDILPIDIRLDESLDRISSLKLMKICLRASFQFCLYCNHARKIVVNGKGLAQHFITHHRFHAFVDSITAEELHPEKFVTKFEVSINELSTCFFNLDTYDDHDEEKKEGHVTISHDKLYECFQCRFQTPIHKELYLHNRKMHQKSLINCLMCKTGFYSYSELLCHICPGIANKQTFNDYKFYCCLCNMDNIPSAFRLMVHLRKKHYACDVCLEKCSDQSKLSSHVWKHKLLHICYRCHIFYQNKADIMKHLFWKHGTEGIECKKCLQKKWPHVYHFCIPPATFTCPHCEMQFTRAMALKVHIRLHEDGAKYACTEIGCEKIFISKKLLIRHLERHQSEQNVEKNEEKPEGTVIIPQEIPNGFCTRTIPVVFKRFIKKPAIRKIEIEPKIEPRKTTELEPKKEEEKETKTLPDLPETNLNLSESSDNDSSSDENNDSKDTVPETQKRLNQENVEDEKMLGNHVKVERDENKKNIQLNKTIDDNLEKKQNAVESLIQQNKISTLSDSDDDEDINEKNICGKEEKTELKDDSSIESMKNILENLKTFQEHQQGDIKTESSEIDIKKKNEDEIVENVNKEPEEIPDKLPENVVLHVCFSDHDYAVLYKDQISGATNDDLEDVIKTAKIDKDKTKKSSNDKNEKSKSSTANKKKGEKSAKTKNDDFSSSDTSSGSSSDSSNSSSSGGSSSSSESSTSDSSSSEASSTNITNRPRNKKYTKKRSKKDNKKNENEAEELEPPRDPDEIIYESDLVTDETNTDEDFYDEHPLKVNSELTEKRKQLGDVEGIIENSRPSTPSLPPDEKIEKRMKIKRRKRDHKKSISSPLKRINSEQNSFVNADDESTSFSTNYQAYNLQKPIINPPETPQNFKNSKFSQGFMQTSTPLSAPPRIELHQANQIRQLLQSTQQQPVLPILKEQHHYHNHQNNSEYISVSRVSSAQSSRMNSDNEQSGIKRSQRRRIPNKFYGYTSDDEIRVSQLTQNDPFKPIPPPNLTWNKEDLPSRSKSPNLQQQQQQQQQQPELHRIIPLKLNLNNDLQQQQPPKIYDHFETSMSQQVPKLPINNLLNNNTNNNNNVNNDEKSAYNNYSDSESSNDQLHISEPKKRKRKLPSQNMYAFHTLETPPTVQPNQPPIPRLKLTIGSNNKIRRRNINPLKPPPKKRRKAGVAPKQAAKLLTNDLSMNSSNVSSTINSTYSKQHSENLSTVDQAENNVNQQMLAQEKKQKLEEAIMNTQQYFQRYNHTQVTEKPQDQMENDDERVYCYCRRPYDDLQGMIGCDGPNCQIEWFHFECVGILVPPKGNWFCPECQKEQHQQAF